MDTTNGTDLISQYTNTFGKLGDLMSFFSSPVFIIVTSLIFVGGFVLLYIIRYFATLNMIKKAIKEALKEYDRDRERKEVVIEQEKKIQ